MTRRPGSLRRKVTLQLTPLLDLMLIVIFAQFMDVRQNARRELQAARSAIEQSEDVSTSAQRDRKTLDRLTADYRQLASDKSTLETQSEKQRVDLSAALSQARAERDRIADLAAELLQVSDETLNRILSTTNADERAKLMKSVRNIPDARAADLVKQLLTIDELRKSCDVWDVYVDDNSVVRATCRGDATSFRADTPKEFEQKLFEWSRTLPPPRSVVVVQLTWSDATARAREAARIGLITTLDRMRADRNGRTLFEYVTVGFRAAGEM